MSLAIEKDVFNHQLLSFIDHSPTPFHAVATMSQSLLVNGFSQLREQDAWNLQSGRGYFFTRNDSSIIAFILGQQPLLETGIRMVGAHTDSPCLKVKPQPELHRQGYFQLGVETYGGALLGPWFDRDLSIAKREKTMKKQITIILSILMATLLIASCGKDPSIVGKWQVYNEIYEFKEDGSCTLVKNGNKCR